MGDQANEIVALDPRHPLPAIAHGPAQAELEWRQHPAQEPTFGAEHEADPQPHDTRAVLPRVHRHALPGFAEAMTEAGLAAVELGQGFVLPQPVPADG